MHGLFNRRGIIQDLFVAYRKHRKECELIIKNCFNYNRVFFSDMQRKNSEMKNRFQNIIHEHSRKNWDAETPLDILAALHKLTEFEGKFANLINSKQEYQLKNEALSDAETSARMKRASFANKFALLSSKETVSSMHEEDNCTIAPSA